VAVEFAAETGGPCHEMPVEAKKGRNFAGTEATSCCHGDWLLEVSVWVGVLRDLKVLFSSGNKQTRRRSESHSAKMAATSEPMDDDLIPSGPLLLSRLEVRVFPVFLSD
jgi:hypothetical protein